MHTVEQTVSRLWEEFPRLQDKDVEFVYQALKDYCKKRAKGVEPEEPLWTTAYVRSLGIPVAFVTADWSLIHLESPQLFPERRAPWIFLRKHLYHLRYLCIST